jgi:hypothetical protein
MELRPSNQHFPSNERRCWENSKMVFDSLKAQFTGRDNLTPMQIAQHSLLTAREKLDLLAQLKADATGAASEGREFGFTAEEIEGNGPCPCGRSGRSWYRNGA